MKKVLFISLLLVSAFLISSTGVASAQCTSTQDYRCTVTETYWGEYVDTWTDTVQICYDDAYDAGIWDYDYEDDFYCYVYPATDLKHWVGTDLYYYGGCYAEFQGKSMILQVTDTYYNYGHVYTYRCIPCNGCY